MTTASLSARVFDRAVMYPTIRIASRPGKLLMGVYDQRGGYVEGSALDRRSGERGAPVPPALFPDVTDSGAPEAIYAGTLYFHFGHFLLESLARAWYTRQHPELPLVWAGQHNWRNRQLRPWQLEILELLDVQNPTRILAGPTRFERLHVPDIGYRYDDRFHPEHARFLAHYQGPAQVPGARLWLSRRKISSDVRDLNAMATERRLEQAGWTMGHPNGLTVRQQLDQLCRAETIAGEEGSAFHSLMLLRDITTKTFHVFRRSGPEHGNLQTIGQARAVNQHFHTLDHELILRAKGRAVSKVSPNSSEILDILGVDIPPAADLAGTTSQAALERVLARFEPKRFLDVGTRDPRLILNSTATTRVAVSAEFGFDPRTYAGSGVSFYELRLERYAQWFTAEDSPFDVIRIAGPDFRDFINSFRASKKLAHAGTVWILGSGDRGARVALAIQLTHPGFSTRRLLVRRKIVYLAQRRPGEPTSEREAGRLPLNEVKRRLRRSAIRPVLAIRGRKRPSD